MIPDLLTLQAHHLCPISLLLWHELVNVARVLSAVLAAVTVWQASKVLPEAHEECRPSVPPDWNVLLDSVRSQRVAPGQTGLPVSLHNKGVGRLRSSVWSSIKPPNDTVSFGARSFQRGESISPKQSSTVNLLLDRSAPVHDLLILRPYHPLHPVGRCDQPSSYRISWSRDTPPFGFLHCRSVPGCGCARIPMTSRSRCAA